MFWSTSLGPTWSHWFQSLNPLSKQEQKIFSTTLGTPQCQQVAPTGIHSVRLTERDAPEIQALLNTHFQLQRRCRFLISVDYIRYGLKNGWLAVGLRDREKELVAFVVSKSCDIPSAGVVDFFCVAAPWRKKGLASYILQEILRYTMEKGRYVHYFLKEGYPLFALPPLYSSRYLHRCKNEAYHHAIRPVKVLGSIYDDSQTYIYVDGVDEVRVCLVNHFHRSVPEGWKIGEVFWIKPSKNASLTLQKEAVEAVIDYCEFDLVLMDSRTPHDTRYKWKRDSAYSWYIFNYHPGTFYTTKPMFMY
jgi:GNAT superfamily N-acetyltransferase